MSIYSEHISPAIHREKMEARLEHERRRAEELEAVQIAEPRPAFKADGTRVVSAPPSPSIKVEPRIYRMQARPRS